MPYFNELSADGKKHFVKTSASFQVDQKIPFCRYGAERGDSDTYQCVGCAGNVWSEKLSFFPILKMIHVLADAYQMENDKEIYVGHVAPGRNLFIMETFSIWVYETKR